MRLLSKYLSGVVLGLFLALCAVPGRADDTKRVNVTIPFNFVLGNKQLKAGDYVVQSTGTLGANALLFRSEDGITHQIVFAVPIETNKIGNHERLVFHTYGGEHFVSEIWFMGDEQGYELIPGALEKESAANSQRSEQSAAGQ
jgi:hypothetical protein